MDGRANRSTFFVVQHKIDYMELWKQVDNYYIEHNNSPYIFMNEDTIDYIVKDAEAVSYTHLRYQRIYIR